MHPLLFAIFLGCADPYEETRKVDTIEAWQAYLDTKPTGSRMLGAQDRLEELMVKRAQDSQTVGDYDLVLKKFPNSKQKKKLQEERTKIALATAESLNSKEGWDAFVKENPWADSTIVKRAKNRIAVSAYLPSLQMTEPVVAEVNLAEDPKGVKDGWGVSIDVTNSGEKTIEVMKLEAQLTGADGAILKTCGETFVGPAYANRQPTPEEVAAPLAPGQMRHWSCTLAKADIPEGWSQQAKVVPVHIAFAAAPP